MEKLLSKGQILELARNNDIEYAALKAFIEVESGGKGFNEKTGKIIIQFEPRWFRRFEPFAPSGAWSINKVDVQSKEWIAFNNAFDLSPNEAMKATSIGLMQVMGFHYKSLGFKTVGEMWDFAKVAEINQVELGVRFIRSKPHLYSALKEKNWHLVAYYYNGSKYKEMAKKWKREPYDVSFEKTYIKYS